MKKLEIEKTKPTFIISVSKVEYPVALVSLIFDFFNNAIGNKWMRKKIPSLSNSALGGKQVWYILSDANKTFYNISKASRHLMIFLLFKVFFRYGNCTFLMFLFISLSCHLSRQNAVLQINSRIFREIATFTSRLSSINDFLNIF